MRAVAEHHEGQTKLPPVRIVIVKAEDDLTIKARRVCAAAPRGHALLPR